jgi:glycosyltransferase involved in cell wall biosynthesis
VNIAAVVLTLNEEPLIERRLASLSSIGEVVVVDSGSADNTLAIAERMGARTIVRRPASRFLATEQRNWVLEHGGISAEWVLFLDADEVATPEFLKEVAEAVGGARPEVAGFWACPKFMYQRTWLKRYMGYPNWHPRVIRRASRLDEVIWEDFAPDVVAGRVREPYIHFPGARGIEDWVARHARSSIQDYESPHATRGRPVDLVA